MDLISMGRLALHASAGHARDDALGQEEIEDEGRQKYNDDRGDNDQSNKRVGTS